MSRGSETEREGICVRLAGTSDRVHASAISSMMAEAAAEGAIIAIRSKEEIEAKMASGHAVLALDEEGRLVGFTYFSAWEGGRFVSTSGLIIARRFRGRGLSWRLKETCMELARSLFPRARIFSLTMSSIVQKMNRQLGFQKVPYSRISQDPEFWKGCGTCPHYPELLANRREICHCTAMLLRSPVEARTGRGGGGMSDRSE